MPRFHRLLPVERTFVLYRATPNDPLVLSGAALIFVVLSGAFVHVGQGGLVFLCLRFIRGGVYDTRARLTFPRTRLLPKEAQAL